MSVIRHARSIADLARGSRRRWGAALLVLALATGCGAPATSSGVATAAPQPSAAPLAPAAPTDTPTITAAAPVPTSVSTAAEPSPTATAESAVVDTASLPVAQAPADRQAFTVTILHTNDTRGEIEPCG
jgi:2',3'-cyclic-nucleotide 2'-phosphodiesterase (5'-nucleotidase family)